MRIERKSRIENQKNRIRSHGEESVGDFLIPRIGGMTPKKRRLSEGIRSTEHVATS